MQFNYGSQFASYEPNAIKIWARTSTATSGLTINDLKITTPGVTGQTVFPGASIAVSQASGTIFQEIIIAGIDFQSVSGGTVTLEGNVTMQFGTDPALRGSALQFHVIATHIPWVDLDVDSNNDGTIDLTNGRTKLAPVPSFSGLAAHGIRDGGRPGVPRLPPGAFWGRRSKKPRVETRGHRV